MADERSAAYRSSPPTQWGQSPHIYPHSHHGTPAQEYSGFNFGASQMPMEPSAFSSTSIQQRAVQQQLQPLVMPQWPSMLNSSQPHSTYQPMYPQPVQPVRHMSVGSVQTPVSATSSRPATTPRKTLTDLDRKRMCQYAEEHPNSKQTEIGAIFGVERSTVSKVLRQKEKYLFQDDGSRSPIKRAKGRSPDIERALAVWAKNQVSIEIDWAGRLELMRLQEKKGNPLSDELIREKARAFAATTTTPENQVTLSSSWIEKFKLKNNLMGARSRKASLVPDDIDNVSVALSSSHTPGERSPGSPSGPGSPSPIDLHSQQSHESLKHESPDSYLDFGNRHGPLHSQSVNSLHSAFTDTAPSSFSPVPLSPTSSFFTPDSGTAPSPFVPPPTARQILPSTASSNSHRPRSQTFPLMDYMATPSEATTPKYADQPALDSPMEDSPHALGNLDEAVSNAYHPDSRPHAVHHSEAMGPPPLPAHIFHHDLNREATPATSMSSLAPTSPEEARRALEVVLSFFQQQPNGFLDLQESVTIGKLMEKLKLQSSGSS